MSTPFDERIPTRRILVYSAPVLGVFMPSILINFYLLKFSTDVLLIAPATIGFILLVARIWDAVTDPAAGWLSDRTETRLGRRRPWFLGSALPFAVGTVMLWSPPASLEGTALSLWIGGAVILFYTAYTAFRVPHLALGAELSRGYHDRTRVFGIMQMVESIGMLTAAGGLVFLENAEDPRAFARTLAIAIAVFATTLIVIAAWKLEERVEFRGRGGGTPWRAFGDVFSNPHALILVGVFFLEQLGFGMLVTLMPYLADYVLDTPGRTGVYLFGAIGTALVSIPFWMAVSRRLGKRPVWLFSIASKVLLFAGAWVLGPGDFGLMLTITIVFGAMYGCSSVLGPSLKADVVDWDEARTGERKEGAYFAAWNFVQKAAAGVAVWIIGVMLASTDFVPNAVQGEETVNGIRMLASVVPSGLHVLALLLMLRFGLDEAAHRAAREQADARLAAS